MAPNNTHGISPLLQQICRWEELMDIIMLVLILEVQFSNIMPWLILTQPQEFITLLHLTHISKIFNIHQDILIYTQLQTLHMFINMTAAQEITLQHICILITQLLIWTLSREETNKLSCWTTITYWSLETPQLLIWPLIQSMPTQSQLVMLQMEMLFTF